MSETRIDSRFAALRAEGRAGLVTFLSAGDPDPATSLEIVKGLPAAGADLIELGMPFTDPMADGPSVQAAGLRALRDEYAPRRLWCVFQPHQYSRLKRFLKDFAQALTAADRVGSVSAAARGLIECARSALEPQRLRGAGEVMHIDHTSHPASRRLALAQAREMSVSAFGLSETLLGQGNNGHFAPFSWAG